MASFLIVIGVPAAFAQKGVDTQTQKIRDDNNKTTSRTTDGSRSINFGKGKTVVRERLPNPYRLNGRRDAVIEMITQVLKEKRLIVDEGSSKLGEGFIVTQPFVFSKGSVITQNELNRYGIIESPNSTWSRAQYTLTIEVQSIDGIQNNVIVNAKVEGRSGSGLSSEWLTVRSSGQAEEEFLIKLVELATGVSPDQPVDIN